MSEAEEHDWFGEYLDAASEIHKKRADENKKYLDGLKEAEHARNVDAALRASLEEQRLDDIAHAETGKPKSIGPAQRAYHALLSLSPLKQGLE